MHNCVSCYLTSLASQRFCDSPWCRDSFSVTSCTQLLPARLVDSFDFRGLAGDKREAPASARILGMTTILFKVGNMNLRVKPLQCDLIPLVYINTWSRNPLSFDPQARTLVAKALLQGFIIRRQKTTGWVNCLGFLFCQL